MAILMNIYTTMMQISGYISPKINNSFYNTAFTKLDNLFVLKAEVY
jgi:hypothetical protein